MPDAPPVVVSISERTVRRIWDETGDEDIFSRGGTWTVSGSRMTDGTNVMRVTRAASDQLPQLEFVVPLDASEDLLMSMAEMQSQITVELNNTSNSNNSRCQ